MLSGVVDPVCQRNLDWPGGAVNRGFVLSGVAHPLDTDIDCMHVLLKRGNDRTCGVVQLSYFFKYV